MKEQEKLYLFKILMSIFSVLTIFLVLSIEELRLNIILTSLSLITSIVFSYLYYSLANTYYFKNKHEIEVNLFSLVGETSIKKLQKIDKDDLTNKIYKLSTCETYKRKYFLEVIPGLICGTLLFCYVGITEKIIFIPIILILSIITFILRKNTLTKKEISYEQDLKYLNEFINKIITIKKLNIFNFANYKLDENLEPKYYSYDFKYFFDPICIILFVLKFALTVFLLIKVKLLATLLFVIAYLALTELWLYGLAYGLIHNDEAKKLHEELENMLEHKPHLKRLSLWHSITIKDGLLEYEEDAKINVPLLEIEKLDHVSILGKEGEGKSSILNIVSDLYDLKSGEVLIDGKKKEKSINSIYLCEEIAMFNMTLKDNLCLGNETSDKHLRELIKEVGLGEWLDDLEHGLNTEINNDLELTIKEKLNLVRAIILDADLYLLDNPTAKMELESEKYIAAVIKKYLSDKTYVVVTSRPVLTTMCNKHYFIKNKTLMEKESLL